MSELTPQELAALRAAHVAGPDPAGGLMCLTCGIAWPCGMVWVLDRYEALLARLDRAQWGKYEYCERCGAGRGEGHMPNCLFAVLNQPLQEA